LLLGHQMMSMRRFGLAAEAFVEATKREESEVRAHYGAGHAYFQAAETKQTMGSATPADVAPPELTVENLYQEALRFFRRGQELAADKGERDELGKGVSTVERALARRAGRL
jgi:hypothetical protein